MFITIIVYLYLRIIATDCTVSKTLMWCILTTIGTTNEFPTVTSQTSIVVGISASMAAVILVITVIVAAVILHRKGI